MNTTRYSLPPVTVGPAFAAASQSWAFPTWKVDDLRKLSDGSGVIAAVLDTGGDASHPDLRERIIAAKDFTGSRFGHQDRNGHGTHCLGTVGAANPLIGVSQGCKLLNGKVLGDSGSGGDSGIAAGIDWAVASGAEVISMSLGSSSPSATIKAACERAVDAGVWVIAAAGNEGNAGIGFPGGFLSTISVAAIDRNFRVANFSSRGDKLDCSGPGVDIVSCKPGGGYQTMSGTSMATPFVAGLLTLLRAAIKASGAKMPTLGELRTMLASRSVDLGIPGDDRDYGPGWVSPLMLGLSTVPNPLPIGG